MTLIDSKSFEYVHYEGAVTHPFNPLLAYRLMHT